MNLNYCSSNCNEMSNNQAKQTTNLRGHHTMAMSSLRLVFDYVFKEQENKLTNLKKLQWLSN